jgi:hypothetical protein
MTTSRLRFALIALFMASSLGAAPARDAGKPNPDEPAIHDYVLTMDNVRRYAELAKKMRTVKDTDPALVAEMKKIGDTSAYNVEKAAMMERSPKVAAFLKSNAITAREFVLIPMTVLTASLAMAAEDMKGKPPAFVNPVNIRFVRDHRAEIEKLNLAGAGDTEGDEGAAADAE